MSATGAEGVRDENGAAGAQQPAASGTAGAPAPPAVAPQGGATTSLYVGELHADVTEAMLYELFSQVGPISSIRVCRDAITRRSLGYAYVNFHAAGDCERALETLNYVPIRGQACRLMWSQRDPALRRSGVGNVFIKNLDKSIDNRALHDTFSAFGPILSCKVVLDERGASKGYGYVHFETREAADEAVAKVNGMLLNGVKVFVGPHVSRKERFSAAAEARAHYTNVYVKNLPEDADEEALKALFAPFGEVQSLVVARDETGRSRGFGFVNYVRHEDAAAAVAGLADAALGERKLYVGRAQKKFEREEELRRQFEALKLEQMAKYHGVNLYVKNLDEGVSEEVLRAEFAPYGSLTSVKIMADERGVSRGFGFVCFSAPEEAARAIAETNGRMLAGKPLYVALAQRRDERRAQLESQFAQRAQQMRMQAMAAAAAGLSSVPLVGMGIYQQGPLFYPGPGGPRFGPRPYGLPPGMRPGRPVRPPGAFVRGPAPGPFRRPFPAPLPGPAYVRGPRVPGGARLPPLTAAALAAAPPEAQKEMLGHRLYPEVAARDAEHAAKITGMLLEMDNGELLHLLDAPDALAAKVREAQDVLREHASAVDAA